MKIKSYHADGLLLLAAISWGTTFALVQDAIKDVPVYTFLFWRFFLAFLIVVAVIWKRFDKINKHTLSAAMILGIVNFGAYAFQTYGLSLTLSSTVAFITGFFVVLVPIFAYLLFRQPVSKYVWAGSLVAIVGLWFITGQGKFGIGLGEIYTFVCAILFGLHVLFTDRFSRKYDIPILVAFQFGTMGLAAAIMGTIKDHTLMPDSWTQPFVLALFVTIVFATIFAFWVQTSMQRFTTPGHTALIFTMEPVSAAIFGYLYLGETLSRTQLLGGGLIIAGVLIAELMDIRANKNS